MCSPLSRNALKLSRNSFLLMMARSLAWSPLKVSNCMVKLHGCDDPAMQARQAFTHAIEAHADALAVRPGSVTTNVCKPKAIAISLPHLTLTHHNQG